MKGKMLFARRSRDWHSSRIDATAAASKIPASTDALGSLLIKE